jgi:hypothetical protein
MNVQTAIPASIDLAAIKARQQVAWGSGDYALIGTTKDGTLVVPSAYLEVVITKEN